MPDRAQQHSTLWKLIKGAWCDKKFCVSLRLWFLFYNFIIFIDLLSLNIFNDLYFQVLAKCAIRKMMRVLSEVRDARRVPTRRRWRRVEVRAKAISEWREEKKSFTFANLWEKWHLIGVGYLKRIFNFHWFYVCGNRTMTMSSIWWVNVESPSHKKFKLIPKSNAHERPRLFFFSLSNQLPSLIK